MQTRHRNRPITSDGSAADFASAPADPYAPIVSANDPRNADRLLSQRGSSGQSPVFELRPSTRVVPAWFTVIAIPNPAPTFGTGQSAWYLLRRIVVSKATQLVLSGIRGYLYSPDWGAGGGYGIAGANAAAWGAVAERSAWIVVGRNLPAQTQNGSAIWTPAPAPIPGVEQSVAWSQVSPDAAAEYAARVPFPGGKWSDTNGPSLLPLSIGFGLGEYRVTDSETLDVCLVVRGSQVSGGAGKSIVGTALIECVCEQQNASGASLND